MHATTDSYVIGYPSTSDGTRVIPLIRLAFYVYLASIPFEVADRPIPLEIPTLAGCVFLLTTLLQPRVCFRALPRGIWWLTSFVAVVVISSLLNGFAYPADMIKDFFRFLQLLALLWTGYNLMRDPGIATAGIAVFAVATLIRALLQTGGIGVAATITGRVSFLNQNENYSAKIMAVGVLILIGVTYGRSRSLLQPRFLVWPVVGIIGLAIVQTGSRGALVALVAGFSWLMLGGTGMRRKLTNVAMACAAVVAIAGIAFQSDMMRDRWSDSIRKGSMSKREKIYPIYWQMFCEKPALGWGLYSNNKEAGRRMRLTGYKGIAAHNSVLESLTAAGVAGTLPLAIAVCGFIYTAWRARNGPHGILPLAILMCVLVGNLSGSRLRSKLLWFAFMYAVSCGSHLIANRKRRWSALAQDALVSQAPDDLQPGELEPAHSSDSVEGSQVV